jgi:hypothetical protein
MKSTSLVYESKRAQRGDWQLIPRSELASQLADTGIAVPKEKEKEIKEEKTSDCHPGSRLDVNTLMKGCFSKGGGDSLDLSVLHRHLESPYGDLVLGALRSIFKTDHPYRTRLANSGTVTTSAAGLLNEVFLVSGIGSTPEWSSIDSLFDEFFVHEFKIYFHPFNDLGGGVGNSAAGNQPSLSIVANTSYNAGLVCASLFNGAASYSSAAAMLNNATRAFKHSGHMFTYTWKNNVKFDPHGIAINSSLTSAWQGWNLITNATQVGGSLQIRTINDAILGTGAVATNLGTYIAEWNVSFRARS